jgi:hypothetical protein
MPPHTAHGSRRCARSTVSRSVPAGQPAAGGDRSAASSRPSGCTAPTCGCSPRPTACWPTWRPFAAERRSSGTCFEAGYAAALGKPLYGYLPDAGSYVERLRRKYPEWLGERPGQDRDGNIPEAFGLPLNLMLAVPTQIVSGGPREALELLRQDLRPAQ